ncbi:MAG TPA: hypothetical protein VM802_15775 [Chitinophaga sp.]|uniref:hypothetical protein n=1 Tax=Chitinophaga sp. TaxID=1869181 RepID=UPI002B8E960E|nr:hypothetical protein [Chitinophaga sp.]HVI46334.1 hypothetical protein [Chitinophaga sp.]
MAKQTSLLTFTGKLGNLIGYRRNSGYFLRSMPAHVRQTAATRRAAQRFGMASSKGALIRNAFAPRLDVHCNSEHINRLTSALIPSAGKDTGCITGFRFNRKTGTDKFLTAAPRLSRNNILYIPPQTLPAYNGISALEIKVIAARIHFATHQVTGTESAVLIVKPGEPFEGAACDMDVPGRGTLVVMLQIRGILGGIPSNNTRYLAADIIAVQPPQIRPILRKPTGQKRPRLKPASESIPVNTSTQHLLPTVQRE